MIRSRMPATSNYARQESKHWNPVGKPSKTITLWPKQTGQVYCNGLSLPGGSGRGWDWASWGHVSRHQTAMGMLIPGLLSLLSLPWSPFNFTGQGKSDNDRVFHVYYFVYSPSYRWENRDQGTWHTYIEPGLSLGTSNSVPATLLIPSTLLLHPKLSYVNSRSHFMHRAPTVEMGGDFFPFSSWEAEAQRRMATIFGFRPGNS